MKVRFIGREKYSSGTTFISAPSKDTPREDKFIYEVYSEKNDGLKSKIVIVDVASDTRKIRHLNIINKVISAVNELNEKENIYDNLSEDEKDIMNKFKELYKWR